MNKLYLFYVESNFHLLLSLSYISSINLSKEDVLFVTHRGVVLPKEYSDRLLYDGTECRFKERITTYNQNKKRIKKLLCNRNVVAFSPFQFRFPICTFFRDYGFIEEGFSAYMCNVRHAGIRERVGEFVKLSIVNLLFPFAPRNVKGYVMGVSYSKNSSRKRKEIVVSHEAAYSLKKYTPYLRKIVVPIHTVESQQTEIKNSVIIIMDRLNSFGRPFDRNNYLAVLKNVIKELELYCRKTYIKMHPSDFKHPESVDVAREFFSKNGIPFMMANYNLESIALSNNNNTFIGANSTILYYAPIFGNTNKSISFSKLLASVDESYSAFLEGWGGTEKFCELFAKQVTILN